MSSFGEGIPFGDPLWYQGWHSPYYNESHHAFRAAVREFVEKNLAPYVHEWDERGELPRDLPRQFAQAGILAAVVGPPWPSEYAPYPILGGVKHEEVSTLGGHNDDGQNLLLIYFSLMLFMN